MNYVRRVKTHALLEHAGIDWRKAPDSAGPSSACVWHLTTPVNAQDTALTESKLFKSIKDEVDDASKKSSLLMILGKLNYAIRSDDYQEVLKGTPVQVKVAHSFKFNNSTHKVWELKYQNKDRMYFFTHRLNKSEPQFVLLQFHHKKDQNTPERVKNYCENAMRPFLMSQAAVQILKE